MIIITKDGIHHQGTKQELMLDLVNLLYTFTDFVPLDENEINRLEICFGPMLRQESVEGFTERFNSEQRTKIINELYDDMGIKRMSLSRDSDGGT